MNIEVTMLISDPDELEVIGRALRAHREDKRAAADPRQLTLFEQAAQALHLTDPRPAIAAPAAEEPDEAPAAATPADSIRPTPTEAAELRAQAAQQEKATLETVLKAMREYGAVKGPDAVREVLKRFGIARVSQAQEKDLDALQRAFSLAEPAGEVA